jgi:hypothetical protein
MKLVFPKQITPRWLIFSIDLALCAFAFIAAYLIRFEFAIPKNESYSILENRIQVLFVLQAHKMLFVLVLSCCKEV